MPRIDPRATTGIGRVPTRADLTIYQGDDIFVRVVVDVTVDLTGYTPKAEIRSAPGGALVASFDATVVDPTTLALHLPNDQSVKLTGNAAWDVQIIDTAGQITTLAYGSITTMKEVTQ